MLASPPWTGRCSTLNGTDIHYISSGKQQGRLVVLLHGLGGSTETFRDLIPFLPRDFHIVAVDIEGFGESPLNEGKPLSFARYVADIHDLITHVQTHSTTSSAATTTTRASSKGVTCGNTNAQGFLLVGHSLGGIISLHYAAQHPSQVGGLLLLGVGRSMRGILPAQQRMRDLATTAREKGMDIVAEIAVKSNLPPESTESQRHQVHDAVSRCSTEAYAATAELVAGDDHWDPEYKLIKCPVVLMAGDEDVISPVQRSEDIASLLGGPSEVVVVQSGHQMIMQDLQGVMSALDKLLLMTERQ